LHSLGKYQLQEIGEYLSYLEILILSTLSRQQRHLLREQPIFNRKKEEHFKHIFFRQFFDKVSVFEHITQQYNVIQTPNLNQLKGIQEIDLSKGLIYNAPYTAQPTPPRSEVAPKDEQADRA